MARTIGNPLSWTAEAAAATGRHLGAILGELGSGETAEALAVRPLAVADLREALRRGFDDFVAFRTDVVALCLLYPVIGVALVWLASDRALLPVIFPLVSGFALVGPLVAVGLYEMSRRRERGEAVGWATAFGVLKAPAFGAIVVLGLGLLLLFLVWLLAARGVHALTLGTAPPASLAAFAAEVLTTPAGWAMIGLGLAVGFLFAAGVLAVSLVSFPLLLDRPVGLPVAVATSLKVVATSPRTAAVWGLIVAALLALGSLPAFLGLVVVLPVLGHATWHLYRRAVAPAEAGAAGAVSPG